MHVFSSFKKYLVCFLENYLFISILWQIRMNFFKLFATNGSRLYILFWHTVQLFKSSFYKNLSECLSIWSICEYFPLTFQCYFPFSHHGWLLNRSIRTTLCRPSHFCGKETEKTPTISYTVDDKQGKSGKANKSIRI